VEQVLESTHELLVDPFETGSLLLGGPGVGKEITIVAIPAADWQFVTRQANFAPMFLP